MSTPPTDSPGWPDPAADRPASPPDQVSLDKPSTPAAEPFDPYRFGAPEHPVPPEYAPPGYQPPPPAAQPPTQYPGYPGGYPGQPTYPGQPGQPYPAPPPQYLTQYPPPQAGQGKAIAALVLGIISIVFFWMSFLDAIPILLALIFGSLALSDSKRTGLGRGQAIAGLVCAVVGAALAIVLTVVIVTRLQPCFDNYSSGSAAFNKCVQDRI